MVWFRSEARQGVAVLIALLLGVTAAPAAAQAPSPTPRTRPQKSVYGKLQSVDTGQNSIIMKSDGGQQLAWRLDAPVIAEVAKIEPGSRLIVIYRQVTANEKRVTAVAFPGTATTPIYVNMTGARVVVRSAPFLDGVCGKPEAGPVNESTIPAGGLAEVLEACWCCAPAGDSCVPGNKSGLGRALLVRCFE